MSNVSKRVEKLTPLQRAFLALKEIRSRLDEMKRSKTEPIAIIGLSCRFPGSANDPESFWGLLRNGVDAITEVPPDRWDIDAFFDPNPDTPGKMNTRWGGFLDKVDQFDAQFFGIAPREAMSMDPQQRLLLEVSWEALENAGQVPNKLVDSQTSVFIGLSNNDYLHLQMNLRNPTSIDAYCGTGNAASVSSGRLSYILGLQGPNMVVDTACSSSLVTVHLACQSLRSKECDLALAGGVNLILSPESMIYFSRLRAMASDGRCKTFDAAADGYVRGEGCGIIVLKRLSDAITDGDNILALIRGSAVNHDGRSSGLTVPNGRAQQAVIRKALANAEVEPAEVSYVEAHGTGTSLGDPIEVQALAAVYGEGRRENQHLVIGSVKTNIGHLEAAAGIAGLIKVVLALKHEEIPPHLNLKELNPLILWEDVPIVVKTERTPWLSAEKKRIAGVSAFGFSGTNVHVVLEEAPQLPMIQKQEEPTPGRVYILPLSAHSPEALQTLAQAYKDFLENDVPFAVGGLHDICYTASVRRNHHEYRLALSGESSEELIEHLTAFLQGEIRRPGLFSGHKPLDRQQKLVFVFPGQGSQWIGMGRELMEHEPAFRSILQQCDQEMRKYVYWSLLEELTADKEHSRLDEIDVIQPVFFAIQVALTALWRSWGIEPDAVVGYSMGEVPAAHICGALSLENAIRVICSRSRLLKQATGQGSMAVIELSLEKAQQTLTGYENRVSIAASTSPTLTVLSGDPEALGEVLDKLQSQGVFCLSREENVATHSSQLEPLCADLVRALEGLQYQSPSLPIFSTVTGEVIDGLELDASYWVQNLRRPVLFSKTVQQLLLSGHDTFLEISPHPSLLSSIQEGLNLHLQKGTVLPSLKKKEGERAVMLESLGVLYSLGYPVDWSQLYPCRGRNIRLPFYPWQRERYWLEIESGDKGSHWEQTREDQRKAHKYSLIGRHLDLAHLPESHIWEIKLDSRFFPYLNDHRIQGAAVMPISVYIEMVLAAATEALGAKMHILREIEFQKMLFLPENSTRRVQVIISSRVNEEASFHVYSRPEMTEQKHISWTLHAKGNICKDHDSSTPQTSEQAWSEEIRNRCLEEVSGEDFYSKLREREVQYGPFFQRIKRLWRGDGETLGELEVSPALKQEFETYQLHPAILDTCLQVLAATVPIETTDGKNNGVFFPIGVAQVRVQGRSGSRLWSHARLRLDEKPNEDTLEGDVRLLNEAGKVIVEAIGMRFQYMDYDAQLAPENLTDWLYKLQWQPKVYPEKQQAPESTMQFSQGSWLIFADSGGVGKALAQRLAGQGEKCILVSPGEAFKCTYKRNDKEHFRIQPTRQEDFQQLLGIALGSAQFPCRGIVYLWGLNALTPKNTTESSLEMAQILGCNSILYLIQELVRAELHESPPVWLVTRGAQPVGDDHSPLQVAQTPIWGFGRVIAAEHPELWGGLVDLDPKTSVEKNTAQLKDEIWSPNKEDQLAFRQGQCYVARLKRSREFSKKIPPFQLQSDASYLITGGLGDLGLEVARWMAKKGARRLILLGRTKIPPRSSWDRVDKGSRLMLQIAAIGELEKMDVNVYPAAVDVANEAQLTSFLEEFNSKGWPPIKGVIHAAGVSHGGTLLNLDDAAMSKVFRPKVVGGWLLHRLFENTSLDFFIVFSAVPSLLGWLGQGAANYAAANAFLDALAYYRRYQNQPCLSIIWGPWSKIGMAARKTGGLERLTHLGISGIAPKQGITILEHLSQHDSINTAVVKFNWQRFFKSSFGAAESPFLSYLVEETKVLTEVGIPGEQQSKLREELLRITEPEERHRLLESYFREKLAKILRLPVSKLNVHQPIIEMGLDSLMALEMKTQIQVNLGVSIPLLAFLQNPSLAKITTQVLNLLEVSSTTKDKTATIEINPSGKLIQDDQEDPKQLLAKIDKLSDEEVDKLLRKLHVPREDDK